MRLLIVGDLAATGFGTVTMNLGREMLALGHDLRFLSQNDLGELPEPFASRTFAINEQKLGWMNAQELYEKGIMAGLIDGSLWEHQELGRWVPEVVILTGDFYAARGLVFRHEGDEKAFRSIPVLHYAPIEGQGLPPAWKYLWDFVHPIAMSEFGATEIQRIMGVRPPVIYHGVDTQTFFPASATKPIRLGGIALRSKEECKAYFHIPTNARVLLRTDRNMPRKDYAGLMWSLAPVMAERPDVILLMHCRLMDEGGDIRDVHSSIEAKYGRNVTLRMKATGFPDKGIGFPRDHLNALYNTADLYVSVSSEGFGLTIAEALACGVPAVGQDYSSVPEVIGPAGKTVQVRGEIRNPYAHAWGVIDERAFARTVADLLDNPAELGILGAKGPHHIREHFSWARAAAQFIEQAEAVVKVKVAA